MISLRQFNAWFARSLYTFLLDGVLKAHGVIMEETVRRLYTQHYKIGVVFTLQSGICYLIAPFATNLIQRLNLRLTAILGGLLAGAGYIGRAVFPPKIIFHLFIFLSISGIGFGFVNVITVISLKESFDSRYPTAYSISMFASYIGVAVLPPLLSYLETAYGTQEGMLVFGMMTCSLIITGLIIHTEKTSKDANQLVESKPEKYKEAVNAKPERKADKLERSQLIPEKNKVPYDEKFLDGKDETTGGDSTFKDYLTLFTMHPEFTLLVIIASIGDIQFASWSIFLVPYGEYLGIDSQTAVLFSTIGGISGFVGRVFCSVLFYWNRMNLTLGLFLPATLVAIGYTISFVNRTFWALAIMSSLSGFGISVQTCVSSSWVPSCVSEYHFKLAVTVYYCIGGVATLLAGLSTGAIVDLSGSYHYAFVYLTALSVIQVFVTIFWLVCPSVASP